MFWYVLLTIVVFLVIVGLSFYITSLVKFKNFLKFENKVMASPSDEGVKEYMRRYESVYVPGQQEILASREHFFQAIRKSDQVSYETKKELRKFFEEKGVLTSVKGDQ